MNKQDILRSMPRVDEVVAIVQTEAKAKLFSYDALLECVRITLDELRNNIASGKTKIIPEETELAKTALKRALAQNACSLSPVINATGVVLHTNLGRAPIAQAVAEHVRLVATDYCTLEYSLASGARGSRHTHVESLLCKLTGAEAAMAVNNNAAAVLLVLMSMCAGKEVVVSRGELVEIGGSFRVPEIMSMGGAILREVGTTNKTRLSDYKQAINEQNTAALLKVHTSNFKIVGFSEHVEIEALAKLGKETGLPVIYDLGSGLMVDNELVNIANELTVKECVFAGADVVCFSADKLLGGPQAGIIVGRKKYIEVMKNHQLARALRIDKLNLAALESTLRIYLDPARALKEIPTLANLSATPPELKLRAKKLCSALPVLKDDFSAEVKFSEAQVGGGSAPGELLQSFVVQISPISKSTTELEKALREYEIPIITRIQKDKVLIDPRTVSDLRFKDIVKAFEYIFKKKS